VEPCWRMTRIVWLDGGMNAYQRKEKRKGWENTFSVMTTVDRQRCFTLKIRTQASN